MPQAKNVKKIVCLKLLSELDTMECDRVASESIPRSTGTGNLSHFDRQSSRCICVRPVVTTPRLRCRGLQTSILPRYVLANEMHLAVLRIAASLPADPAADEMAVRNESV